MSIAPSNGRRSGHWFGKPLFIFTGGDPLERTDILELISQSGDIYAPACAYEPTAI